jgi:hypothetical protein
VFSALDTDTRMAFLEFRWNDVFGPLMESLMNWMCSKADITLIPIGHDRDALPESLRKCAGPDWGPGGPIMRFLINVGPEDDPDDP